MGDALDSVKDSIDEAQNQVASFLDSFGFSAASTESDSLPEQPAEPAIELAGLDFNEEEKAELERLNKEIKTSDNKIADVEKDIATEKSDAPLKQHEEIRGEHIKQRDELVAKHG